MITLRVALMKALRSLEQHVDSLVSYDLQSSFRADELDGRSWT
ncbi:MAG: hypothetical protein ACLUGQ_11135 [Coprococcus sp.]